MSLVCLRVPPPCVVLGQEVLGGGFRTRSDSLVFDPGRPATPESYSLVSKCFLPDAVGGVAVSRCVPRMASINNGGINSGVSHPTQKRFGKRVLVRKNMLLVFPWGMFANVSGGLRVVHKVESTH